MRAKIRDVSCEESESTIDSVSPTTRYIIGASVYDAVPGRIIRGVVEQILHDLMIVEDLTLTTSPSLFGTNRAAEVIAQFVLTRQGLPKEELFEDGE